MLTDEQVAHCKEWGFTGPIQLFSREEMADKVEDLVANIVNETSLSRSIFGVHCNRDIHLYSKTLFDVVTSARLKRCIEQLVGPDALLWRTTTFYKAPAEGDENSYMSVGHIDWHHGMDFMVPATSVEGLHPALGRSREENLRSFPYNITAWIAFDDATVDSGTLMFVPGSQKLGPRPWLACEPGTGFHGMGLKSDYESVLDTSKAVTVEVPAGSCVLFDNLVYHSSTANRSSRRRLGVAARFTGSDVPVYPNGDTSGYAHLRWGCVHICGRRSTVNKMFDQATARFQ